MRLSILGPDHLLLDSPRAPRWLLLGFALLCLLGATRALDSFGATAPALLAVAFAALLLLMALSLLLCQRQLELRRDGVQWRCRGLFGDREVEAPRTALRHLRLRGLLVKSRHHDQRHLRYLLELVAEHPDLPPCLPLSLARREAPLRRFAETLARAANLPLLDAVGDEPQLRQPGALDGPPPARTPLPALAASAAIALLPATAQRGAEARTLPPRRGRWAIAAMAMLVALAGPALLLGDGHTPPALVWAMSGVATAMILLGSLVRARRRQRVFVCDGELHVVHELLGLPLRRQRLPTAAIERVRVQSGSGTAPQLRPGVAVVSDHSVLVVGTDLQTEDLQWLQAWIEAQVWPTLPTGPTPGAR